MPGTGRCRRLAAATVWLLAIASCATSAVGPERLAAEAGLVSVDAEFMTQCQEAADQLGFAVPCPTALLTSATRCPTAGMYEGCMWETSFFLAPSVGATDLFHLVIEAAPGAGRIDECGDEELHEQVEVQGLPAAVAQCPSLAGLVADHTVVNWADGEVTIEVSLHGHSERDRQVILAVAENIEMISPR